jgi:oligosaccharide repeat unit polymerase
VATLEVCVFWSLAGSRTRVLLLLFMLAVVAHTLWRPWPRRTVAAGIVVCLLLGGALLSIRQATLEDSFGHAVLQAPQYIVHPNGILNDFTEFDILFYATSLIPAERDYGYGQGIVDALASYVPGPILSDKPESTDQEFRRFVWGRTQKGGRPYTIVGDLYNDFSFPGIAVGAVLFGIAGRLLLALLRAPAGLPGRRRRVALYAIGASVFYMALATAYTLPIGFVIELALPFFVTVGVLGRVPGRAGPRRRAPAPESEVGVAAGEPAGSSA